MICGVFGIAVVFSILKTSFEAEAEREIQYHLKKELVPMANYVSNFRDSKGCLPSEEEFNTWAETNFNNEVVWYYTNQPPFMKTWGVDGRDFVVGIWMGEWIQCYSSWAQKTFSNSK